MRMSSTSYRQRVPLRWWQHNGFWAAVILCFIKIWDLESHRFDTKHKGWRNFLLHSTGSGGRVCKSSYETIWCVTAKNVKCRKFSGTLVLVWVEGASLWLRGLMDHITHTHAHTHKTAKSQRLRGGGGVKSVDVSGEPRLFRQTRTKTLQHSSTDSPQARSSQINQFIFPFLRTKKEKNDKLEKQETSEG